MYLGTVKLRSKDRGLMQPLAALNVDYLFRLPKLRMHVLAME